MYARIKGYSIIVCWSMYSGGILIITVVWHFEVRTLFLLDNIYLRKEWGEVVL